MANATCSVDGCSCKHYARSWCRIHYTRWRTTGTLDLRDRPPAKPRHPCSVDDCSKPNHAQGLCGTHYYRLQANGDPLKTQIRPRTGKRSCARCERTPNEVPFRKDKRAHDGLGAYCKQCEREYNRAYHEANREKQNAENNARYEANRGRYLAQQRKRRRENGDELRAREREQRRGCPKRIERARRWRQQHPERFRETVRRWFAANPDRVSAHAALRRMRERGRDGKVELIDRRAVWVRDHGRCGICGGYVPFAQMHLDHIKPLARGGDHTWTNVQPSHPLCNSKKWAKEVPRWASGGASLKPLGEEQIPLF